MPSKLGALAYPLMLGGLLLSRQSAVGEFERVKAFDESSSRRPESLNVRRKLVQKAVEKGLLVAVGDGRYYVDMARVRRRDRTALLLWGGGGLVVTAALIWLLP